MQCIRQPVQVFMSNTMNGLLLRRLHPQPVALAEGQVLEEMLPAELEVCVLLMLWQFLGTVTTVGVRSTWLPSVHVHERICIARTVR